MTLIIAGDVDVDVVIADAARTFGTLPERAAPTECSYLSVQQALREERDLPPANGSSIVAILAPLERADLATDRAALALLVRLLDARLRSRIREQLGATYQAEMHRYVFASNPPLTALYGTMSVAPGDEQRVAASVLQTHRISTLVLRAKAR